MQVTHQQSIFEHVLDNMQLSDGQESVQSGYNLRNSSINTHNQAMSSNTNHVDKNIGGFAHHVGNGDPEAPYMSSHLRKMGHGH